MNAGSRFPSRPTYRLDRELPRGGAIGVLRSINRWVPWDYKAANGKWTKPPRSARTGKIASAMDPASWGTYAQARAIQRDMDFAGVGFVLAAEDEIIGIDLDGCLDEERQPKDWLREILDLKECYAEVSPSGRGLRLLARGTLPNAMKCDEAGVEIYVGGRYLTLTGERIGEAPDSICEAPKTLQMLRDRIALFRKTKGQTSQKARDMAGSLRIDTGGDFFATVKAAALADLGAWVPVLFPTAAFQPGTGAWRVSSGDLGRDLEEDLSLAPGGIRDFGREQGLTALDVVIEFRGASTAVEAALWLCEKLGIDPAGAGYDGARSARGREFARPNGEAGKRDNGGAEAKDGDWPEPLPIVSNLPPVMPFAPELVPDPIRDYVLDVADRQQAPADFAAVVALCALGALLGNRVRVLPKRNDDWTVTPNLWGTIIGRPSAMKTPGMRAALAPVYRLQDQMRDAWRCSSQEAKVEAMVANLGAKDAKRRAERAIKTGDKDEAREIIEAMLANAEGKAASAPRLIVNDSSVEKLGELLNENPRGLLLERDELTGWLARMIREEFQSERAFYLEAFNGDGRFIYDRIGRGTVHIGNCTLSLIGGAQPSRIANLVRAAQTGEADDGLVQRLQLAVWPDDVHSWQWVDRAPDQSAREAFEDVFETLNAMALARTDEPMVLRFTADAQQRFKEWMTEIQGEARGGNMAPTLESHIFKMPKTVASLALIFEMTGGGRFEIGEAATLRALDWADYLRSHANRLYAAADSTFDDAARLILERRSQLPEKFTARDVHQRGWAGLGDRDTVSSALSILIGYNYCRETHKTAGQGGGRPSSEFVWHPSLRR